MLIKSTMITYESIGSLRESVIRLLIILLNTSSDLFSIYSFFTQRKKVRILDLS